MKFVCALFVVEDMAKSKDFYLRVLGQKVKNDFGQNVSFEGGFAIHERRHFEGLIGDRKVARRGNDAELYFEFDDVARIEAELEEEKVEFIHGMREQPWKQRVLRIYDPDWHIVEIGESLEFLSFRLWKDGMSKEEIARTTMMGADFTEQAIADFEARGRA